MATKQQPAALAEATAGGLVAVVMNVLQQQAMAGVLVSEVRAGLGGGVSVRIERYTFEGRLRKSREAEKVKGWDSGRSSDDGRSARWAVGSMM